MVFLIGIIKISIKEKIIRIGVVVLLTNKVLRGYNYKIAITKQLIRIFLKNVLLILTIGLNPILNIISKIKNLTIRSNPKNHYSSDNGAYGK